MTTGFRLPIVLLTAAVLQRGLAGEMRIAGVALEILAVLTIAAGIGAGEQAGSITGFWAGLVFDLLHPDGPLGMWALTYAVLGFVTGRYQGSVTRSSRWFPIATAFIATAGATLGYAVLAYVFDSRNLFDGFLLRVILVGGVTNALLVLPATRLMRWVWDVEVPTRPVVRLR